MKTLTNQEPTARSRRVGFTLIELLVVIAIIGILAALIAGLAAPAGIAKVRNRVTVERDGIISAIETYNKNLGFYPQDNINNDALPPLYYELTGIQPSPQITNQLGIAGVANVDAPNLKSVNFHPNLRPSGFAAIPSSNPEVYVLTVPYKGPNGNFNTWHYRSSKPIHNPESFDLWAEVVVGGEKYTIGNWKD